ncbi:MAG: hypothetical protein AUJ85_03070 [Elusimicrobia bacterium CG1_02_37_114]|nr:MAG: hypothetical protein AUJ85_03070 [Elusimicrobia bacterium CG1_02_37_114]PIV53767.1 MAG: hypothetical protein COS17_02025 [Elusimicrobia bacterium CG02_land_8_20_14_3_00_37_13]PIZ13319.1 MAG: hypothetical protein COY53_05315 [Elusimicrobia bacterium CG_4_10_14_0_8_um_filter_37_32]
MLIKLTKIKFPFKFKKQILACGAESKNTFCFTNGNYAYLSKPLDNLQNYESFVNYEQSIEDSKKQLNIKPEIIAHDFHPEYTSSKYALQKKGATFPVQHHHAHSASCLAELISSKKYDPLSDEKIISVVFDGLGYGDDTNFWGGEFLVCNLKGYRRVAHFEYVPLPGGDSATKEPWRMGCMYLWKTFNDNFIKLKIKFINGINKHKWEILKEMTIKNINSPMTSSVGRLFDAVSAILNIRHKVDYEAQAAIELESAIGTNGSRHIPQYNFEIHPSPDLRSPLPQGERIKERGYIIKPQPVIKAIVEDLQNNISINNISLGFHISLAKLVRDVCKKISNRTGIKTVILTGGVFQNKILMKHTEKLLSSAGFNVYTNTQLPCTDANISLGQALIANFNN